MPDMKDISKCVMCGKDLPARRVHVDTCGERCYKMLLRRQRFHYDGFGCTCVLCESLGRK